MSGYNNDEKNNGKNETVQRPEMSETMAEHEKTVVTREQTDRGTEATKTRQDAEIEKLNLRKTVKAGNKETDTDTKREGLKTGPEVESGGNAADKELKIAKNMEFTEPEKEDDMGRTELEPGLKQENGVNEADGQLKNSHDAEDGTLENDSGSGHVRLEKGLEPANGSGAYRAGLEMPDEPENSAFSEGDGLEMTDGVEKGDLEDDEHEQQEVKTPGRFKKSFLTKNVKFGSYSTILIVIVVAAAVLVNLAASQLPDTVKNIDLSPGNLYTIGERTEEVLDSLDQDVTITVLVEKSSADQTLDQLLKRYESGSKHITVKYVDPETNVGASQTYSDASKNSLVVTCGTREAVIDYSDIYQNDYSSYYTTGSYESSFDGEGQLTGAIVGLTSNNSPKFYSVTGHGETQTGSSLASLMNKQNVVQEDLNLMTSGGIPDDCDGLLLLGPTSDYSAEEADEIIEYLDGGGKALILAAYTENDMTNFKRILDDYGLALKDGIVMETSNHYYMYPFYIVPIIEDTEITSDLAEAKANVLIPEALGIAETGREGVTVTKLLSSSDGAYTKMPQNGTMSTYEKEDGDAEGPFAYACLAEKADSGSLILISAAMLIDEGLTTSFSQVSNLDFYMDCVVSLSGSKIGNVSIEAKSVTPENITVPSLQQTIWLFVTIILIPLIILVVGFIIWFRRRKK